MEAKFEGRWNRAVNATFELAVALVVTYLLYTAILYGLRTVWLVYQETHVGKVWASANGYHADLISWFFDLPLPRTILYLLLSFLSSNLLLLFLARFFWLVRLLYDSQGGMLRWALWGGLLIGKAVAGIAQNLEVTFLEAAVILALPGLSLTPSLMNFCRMVVPEADEVFVMIRSRLQHQGDVEG